ncbi:MAG: hypothetical protein ACLQSR_02555 [Limisphaerales bacterium]
MSSISSISSTTNLYQPANQNVGGQFVQDFQAIGSALQSGNLSTAQSALAAFQQDLQGNSQTTSSQPFGTNTKANSDYQNLVTSLQSGDLTNAKQDFTSLQTDLKSASAASSAHKGHHHHHSFSATDSTATASNPTATNPTASFLMDDDNGLNVTA